MFTKKIYSLALTSLSTFLSLVILLSGIGNTPIIVNASPATTLPTVVITKITDGTAPFDSVAGPGNDTDGNNGIVRAGNSTIYQLSMNLNDPTASVPTPYNNFTVTSSPLPLGFRWKMPPVCALNSASVITGDGITIPSVLKCDLGTRTTGVTFTIPVEVFTLPSVQDDAMLAFNMTANADTVPNLGTSLAPTVIANVLPKIDINKTAPAYISPKKINGVDGRVYAYGLGIKYKAGSEVVKLPITLTDDISGISPNAKLVSCTINTPQNVINLPAGSIASSQGYYDQFPYNSIGVLNSSYYAVADSGTIDCTPNSANSQLIDIKIDNVNTNPSTYPSFTNGNLSQNWAAVSPVTPGDNWIVADVIQVWVPDSDFTPTAIPNATNKFTNFDPKGAISGVANYNDFTLEPGRGLDNTQTASNTALTGSEDFWKSQLTLPAGSGFDKADLKAIDGRSQVGSGYKTNDGTVGNGGHYIGISYAYFTGVYDIPVGFTTCQTIDNRFVELDTEPQGLTNRINAYGSTGFSVDQGAVAIGGWYYAKYDFIRDTGAVLEYGVGGLGGVGTQWVNDSDLSASTCADNESTSGIWYSNINSIPGGKKSVSKLRLRFTDTYTKSEQLDHIYNSGQNAYAEIATNLKVKDDAPIGRVVKNYGKFFDPTGFTGGSGWSGNYTDQVQIVGTRVRINKTINNNILDSINSAPGDENTWYLESTSDSLGASEGRSNDVQIVDTLPLGLNYNVNSSVCTSVATEANPISCEPGMIINSNGTTTLTWSYGSFKGGSVMGKINYKTTSDSSLLNNTTLVNSAEISATNDNSPVLARTNTASVTFVAAGSFKVQKTVLTPFVPIGDQIKYKLLFKNNGSNPLSGSETVDWLPFNGDGRNPASNYSGKLDFVTLANTSGINGTVTYSKYPFASLVAADYDPNTISPSVVFCLASAFGTPGCPLDNSQVTGFKISTGPLNPSEESVWELTELPNTNNLDHKNDIITNRYATRAGSLPLTISNNVFATTTAGKIGDTIYKDVNFNGVQDAGDIGIFGVTVTLTRPDGTPVDCDPFTAGTQPCITTTDTNGNYSFDNLPLSTAEFPTRGDYKVTVTAPAIGNPLVGLIPSGDVDGFKDNTTLIKLNNENPIGGNGINGRTDLTGDFGYRDPRADISIIKSHTQPVAPKLGFDIGDVVKYKFIVTNNGLDAPASFTLTDGFPANLGSITNWTPSVGTYNSATGVWSGLTPANFGSLQFITMTVDATVITSPASGEINNTATVANPKDAIGTAMIDPTGNNTSSDVIKLVSRLTGKVYLDPNYNGVQGAGEPDGSIPAGTSIIIKSTDGSVSYTLTPSNGINPDGTYSQVIPAGTYTVQVVPPATYAVSTSTELGDGTGANVTTVVVGPGQTKSQGKDGLYQPAFVTGKVYMDFNNSGTQDANEPNGAIPAGTTVTINNGTNTFTVPLNADGTYTKEVPPGNYTVTVNPPTGYTVTGGANPSPVVATAGTTTNAGIDGLYSQTKLTGQVYLDLNNSGYQDNEDLSEPNGSIPAGTTVVITDVLNPANTFTVTLNPDGTYSQVVPAGTYTVKVNPPTGYTVSISTELGAGTGANPTTVTVAQGETKSQGKDGLYLPATITGSVYLNPNNNGTQDPTEPNPSATNPLPAGTVVTITSTTNPAITFTVTLNPDGTYSQDLPAGTYTVTVTPPTGYTVSTSTELGAGAGANPTTVTVLSGETKSQGKDGLYQPSSISGFVYKDANDDGIKAATETGIATTVTLTGTDINGTAITPIIVTSDAITGAYSFPNLLPGTYTVTETQPTAYTDGQDTVGTGATTQGTMTNDKLTGIVLGSNQNSINNNFGELVPATITGQVYLNPDNNGTQDAGEPNGSIPAGTTVVITDVLNPANTFTVTLNPDGTYSQVVPAGTYTVKVNPPTGYTVSISTELGAGTGANPTTVTVAQGETKSQGKDGLFLLNPMAGNDTYTTPLNTPVPIVLLDGDTDPSGLVLKVDSINGVTLVPDLTTPQVIVVPNGKVIVIYTATGNPTFSFVPSTGFSGVSSFPYTISNSLGLTSNAIETITIRPKAVDDTYSTLVNTPKIITPLIGDNGTGLTITEIAATVLTPGVIQTITVPNGIVTTAADGTISFTPTLGYTGTSTFPYKIKDANGSVVTANEIITIVAPSGGSITVSNNSSSSKVSSSSVSTVSSSSSNLVIPTPTPDPQLPRADLSIKKTGDKVKTAVNDNLTYTIVVTNNGPVDVLNATVIDALPVGFSTNSITCSSTLSATCPANSVLTAANFGSGLNISSMPNGSTLTFTIVGKVTVIDQLFNTAEVITPIAYLDPTPNNNISSFPNIIDPPSGKKIGTYLGNNIVEWKQVWINERSNETTSAVITDNIPAGTTFVQGSLFCTANGISFTTGCTFNPDNNSTTWKGTIGGDLDHFTEETAINEVVITFQILIPSDMNEVTNQASITTPAGTRKSDNPATQAKVDPTKVVRNSTKDKILPKAEPAKVEPVVTQTKTAVVSNASTSPIQANELLLTRTGGLPLSNVLAILISTLLLVVGVTTLTNKKD